MPDIWVAPTAAGMHAGRDELIDAVILEIRSSPENTGRTGEDRFG